MFVNLKTNKPAFLIEHGTDATYSSDVAEAGKPHHTVTSGEFFATHREATAEELEDFYGTPKERPAGDGAARSATATSGARKAGQPSKPRAIGASAPSPVLRLRGGRGGAGAARKGGEPHGE